MNQQAPSVMIFKESHRRVARMFAAGWTIKEIRRVTGYSWKRLQILHATPAFQQLISELEPEAMEEVQKDDDVYRSLSAEAAIIAKRQQVDKLHEADDRGEFLPMRELLAIGADFGDRFGYSKHTKVSHDHSFADLLDRAIERSGQAKLINGEAKQIEARSERSLNLAPPKAQAEPRTFSTVLSNQKLKRRV